MRTRKHGSNFASEHLGAEEKPSLLSLCYEAATGLCSLSFVPQALLQVLGNSPIMATRVRGGGVGGVDSRGRIELSQ